MKQRSKIIHFSFKYKVLLFLIAVIIGTLSFYYTTKLVKMLKEQEKKRIELWADAYKDILQTDLDLPISKISFRIINENSTIPVIMTDENDKIIAYANLDSVKAQDSNYLHKKLMIMKLQHQPIELYFSEKHKNLIYYQDSFLLMQLQNYPIFQLILVVLFVIIAYILLVISKRAEDNLIWVGMSKETAHQLGTPISSLIAWVEMMKIKDIDDPMLPEVEKDVKRLEMITERFARIGSSPKLIDTNLVKVINDAIAYLKPRTSSKVEYIFDTKEDTLTVKLNPSLFQWVFENLCKNAIDAMSGKGKIIFHLQKDEKKIIIDIEDTGKGMNKTEQRKIFSAGYTSKKYGWGLGLALVKRIVEDYHKGKIYVLKSIIGKGTTFRIELNL
jgi:nitrogen-specific signal transduction histidine kinase